MNPIVHVYINRLLLFINVSVALINVYIHHLGLALFCFAVAYINFLTMRYSEQKVAEWTDNQD